MKAPLTAPKAYKRSTSLENSTWYKGILITQLAGAADTGGAFDLIVSKIRKDTEPPPHVHTREDEFFYVLSGSINFYTESQVFEVAAGESMFLPKGKPHAFLLQSNEAHVMTLVTPGGFIDAAGKMSEPAQKLEIPSDDVLTSRTWTSQELWRSLRSTVSAFSLQRRSQNRCRSFPS
jgi:quercetin dioxygenase-like cupin family protein